MGGPPFHEVHGPSSFGGTGAQFARFEDVQDDFSKLHIDDKKEKDGGAQKSKSTRRVSFNMTKGAPWQYEYYSFDKGKDWRVADRVKIVAPQDELEKQVSKGKKNSSVLNALKKMSPDRRAQIYRLLDEKNLHEENKDAKWHCVFIDSPSPQDREVGGKLIREHRKMDVIVGQHVLAGRAKSNSRETSKPFVGQRSDINEPLIPKDKAKDKDKPAKSGKDGKVGKDHREDLFDNKPLFTNTGIPMGKHAPIPSHSPQHQPFDPAMGQPPGPRAAPPIGGFQPQPPGGNPKYGDAFPHPQPGHGLPNGIEIIDDSLPPNGANDAFHMGDHLPPGSGHMHPPGPGHMHPPGPGHMHPPNPGHMHPPNPHLHPQPPQIMDFHGPHPPLRKQPNRPVILHEPPPGRRHNTKKWMDDSSRESEDDYPVFDEDEYSSHTSNDDYFERLPRRGSLVPNRRSSTRRRGPTYREHHRGFSYPIERPSGQDIRYHSDRDRGETIIERRPRRREAITYNQPPKRLEYHPASPPLTPISTSSYSPSRRLSGLLYPHEFEREREHERFVEDHLLEKHFQDREEALHRRERKLDDRDFFEKSRVLDLIGRRVSGGGGGGRRRYWSGR